MADMYMTKAEFQAYKKSIDEKLTLILDRLYGRDPAELIKLADLDDEVLAALDTTQFYKIGTRIRERDLPTNVASISYVNSKTRGITSAATCPGIIDEVVEAREGEVSLLTNLDNYSTKADIITNVNALLSGTINNTRVQPPAHNDTTSRDANNAHPITAVTNLTTELSLKSYIDEMIGNINLNTAKIVGSINIDVPGTGYTAGGLVVDNTGTGGTGLTGTYTVGVNGEITTITIVDGGTGYLTAPIVMPQLGGADATLTASLTDELIKLDKIESIGHSDLTGTGGADCHPIGAITNLQATLDALSWTINDITTATTGEGKYADVTTWISCWNDVLSALIAATSISAPCFKDLTT